MGYYNEKILLNYAKLLLFAGHFLITKLETQQNKLEKCSFTRLVVN